MNEVLEKALNTQKEADRTHALRYEVWVSQINYTRNVLVPLIRTVFNKKRLKSDLQGARSFVLDEDDYLDKQAPIWPIRGEHAETYSLALGVSTAHMHTLVPRVVAYVTCSKACALEDHPTLDLRILGDSPGAINTNHLSDSPPLRLRLPTPDEAVISKWVTDVLESAYQYWLDTMYDARTYFRPADGRRPRGKVLPLDEWVAQSGFSKYVYKGAPNE